MKKKYALVTLIILSLFFAGCNSTGSNSATVSKQTPFIGGNNGLSLEFLEGQPPAEVFDHGNYPFEVELKVENKGEYSLTRDKVSVQLMGIDPSEFASPVMIKNPSEDLKGKYRDPDGKEVAGGLTYVNFPGFNYRGDITGNTPYTIRATSCYEYGTTGQALICVRQNTLSTTETVCGVSGLKTTYSSGAPIQVQGFEETPAGSSKVRFTFNIQHVGTGLISKLEAPTRCSDQPTDKNKVWVDITAGDMSNRLQCAGLDGTAPHTGYARLTDGKQQISCNFDTTGVSGDFEKLIKVQLKYYYSEHVSQTILVKHTEN